MADASVSKRKYRLEGLGCPNCGAKIEAWAAKLPGVRDAALNYPEKLLILYSENDLTADIQRLCDSVEEGIRVSPAASASRSASAGRGKAPIHAHGACGCGPAHGSVAGQAHPHCHGGGSHEHGPETAHSHTDAAGHTHEHSHGEKQGFPWGLAAGAVLFLLGFLPFLPDPVPFLLYLASAVAAAAPVARGALAEIKGKSMGENVLLVIALVAAFAIGEAREGAIVALLFTLGERLEDLAVGRSRRQIEQLAKIRPDRAFRVREDGTEEEILADAVQVGDLLRIPAHERVAVDCTVLQGESEIDASALTGESRPVYVSPGSTLLSGAMNGNGSLTVRADNRAESSAAARILDMVSESAARKGSSEKFITRFARIYTPVVTALAVLLAVIPPLAGLGGWQEWIYRALVFLVASCPCALVISVPLSFYSGIGAASRKGVLIKGGRYIEALAKARAAAFDKTGTLTTGRLAVTHIALAPDMDRQTALRLAALAESHSPHPAALAIRQEAEAACPSSAGAEGAVEALSELPGLGVSAVIDGRAVLCGGKRLMDANGVAVPWPDAAVYLAVDGKAAAAFQMESELHPDAAGALSRLHALGIRKITMLTGDRRAEAERIAGKLAVDEVKADLLPEDKLNALRALKQENGATLFVGDGINDAPVLAEADAGVAMGLGSAAAIEAGDVVLTSGSLARLPDAVRLSRRVMGVVRFNIAFALTVKAAVLILAAVGFAPMWAAVFADVGVSILSVLNAARLFFQ